MTKMQLSTKVWRDPVYCIAFGFGAGLAPVAPGTFGTLVAIPLYWMMTYLPISVYFIVVLAGFILGVYVCGKVSDDLGVADYGGIVWDEVVGYWVTMSLVPLNLTTMLLGFVLFRLFDIYKPYPISWVDRTIGGGLGIMLDDILAGLAACLVLHLCLGILT